MTKTLHPSQKFFNYMKRTNRLDELEGKSERVLYEQFKNSSYLGHESNAFVLYNLVREHFCPEPKINVKHPRFIECIEESLHQDLDGWTDKQKAVITEYLKDITLACNVMDEMEKEDV